MEPFLPLGPYQPLTAGLTLSPTRKTRSLTLTILMSLDDVQELCRGRSLPLVFSKTHPELRGRNWQAMFSIAFAVRIFVNEFRATIALAEQVGFPKLSFWLTVSQPGKPSGSLYPRKT